MDKSVKVAQILTVQSEGSGFNCLIKATDENGEDKTLIVPTKKQLKCNKGHYLVETSMEGSSLINFSTEANQGEIRQLKNQEPKMIKSEKTPFANQVIIFENHEDGFLVTDRHFKEQEPKIYLRTYYGE